MNHLRVEQVRYSELAFDPAALDFMDARNALWHETEEDRAATTRQAAVNAIRLRWVRAAMKRCLTPRERQLVELHYFQGLSRLETARRARITRQTVSRSLHRAIIKLRRAAEKAEINDKV